MWARSAIPTACNCSRAAARASARPTPRTRSGNATLLRTLMCVKMHGAWETMATPRRRAGTKVAASSTRRSPICARPESSRRVPATTWARVDLPTPLCPTTAVTRPGLSCTSTSQPRSFTVPATWTAAAEASSPESPMPDSGSAARDPSARSPEALPDAEPHPDLVDDRRERTREATLPHGVSVSATTSAATPRSTTPSARARAASDSRAK